MEPNHQMIADKSMFAKTAPFEESRDRAFGRECSHEVKIAADGSHGPVCCSGAVAKIEPGLGVELAGITKCPPKAP